MLVRSGMRKLLLTGATWCIATSAFGGAGELGTVVEPLSATVTYSRDAAPPRPALTTFVGYRITVTNVGGNTINDIHFTGTTVVTDTDEKATFVSVDGASCVVTNAAKTSIDCSLGQLKAGEAFPTFFLFFNAPVKDVTTPLPGGTTDFVTFTGQTIYAEG